MKILKKLLFVSLVSCSVVVLNSCVHTAVPVGDGTITYSDGSYSMNIEGNYNEVYEAALKAVKENNDFVLISQAIRRKNYSANIEGATKVDSTSFFIEINKLTNNTSKATIKFGTFGDQQMSSTLMDQIQKNVK